MKRYVVELEAQEREALAMMTRKGSHRSQKVINALVLLNCDEGELSGRRTTGETIAGVLRISARRVDRVKKRFVEDGLEAALGSRQGRRPKYLRKADGEFEARLVALIAASRPKGIRSGLCVCWRTVRWSSAISTASRTRRCGGC